MINNIHLGVLGGGQLGTMLVRSAIDFGIKVSVMDKNPDAPCSRYTSSFFCGDPMSYNDVMEFGKGVDIITIEKEAVNTTALRHLQKQGVKVYPSPDIIDIIQDKFLQKNFLTSIHIPVAKGYPVLNRKDLENHFDKLPGCLKKCRNGYDGNGVMIIHSPKDIENAFDEPSVLEELIDIKNEISVIVSRNESGTIECYDPVMMIFDQERFILDFQLCPANISKNIAVEACNIAMKIAEELELVGILAVEMFITQDEKLLVNELAPRPHNSGHHTIETCTTSQYEQQLRAVLGLPLGKTKLTSTSAMVNIIEPAAIKKSSMEQALRTLIGMTDVHLHWYGKNEHRVGRKIGHVTITEDNIESALAKAVMVRHILKNTNE